MPSINIREIDRTGSDLVDYLDYTVLVPGLILNYKDETGEIVMLEGLLTNVSDLIKEYVDAPKGYNEDLGFVMTHQLLSRGMSVYYVPAYEYITPESGESGLQSEGGYSLRRVKKPDGVHYFSEDKFLEYLFKGFQDKGKYDLRFITIGGLFQLEYFRTDAYRYAIKCAAERGDAVALVDVPERGCVEDPESGDTESQEVELIHSCLMNKWVQYNFGDIANEEVTRKGVTWKDGDVENETCGRYASVFAPRTYVKLPIVQIEDGQVKSTKQKNMIMPASFIYLTSFMQQLKTVPSWFATAGAVRGASVYANIQPTVVMGDADIALLQPRDGDDNRKHLALNIICQIRPYGNVIWGNRTMHPLQAPANVTGATVQLQASSFLNIRQLCCILKKTLYRAGRRYTFDPNSDALWFNFMGMITPLLDQMKFNQGIRDYRIIQVRTNKKAVLVARVIISPIEAVEDFDLTVELSDSIEVNE